MADSDSSNRYGGRDLMFRYPNEGRFRPVLVFPIQNDMQRDVYLNAQLSLGYERITSKLAWI
jgi:hypothetical protein